MNKAELSAALKIARDKDVDLTNVDDSVLHGCYLPGFVTPVTTTVEVVAKMIRWHFLYLNGGVDSEGLDEFARWSRHKLVILTPVTT